MGLMTGHQHWAVKAASLYFLFSQYPPSVLPYPAAVTPEELVVLVSDGIFALVKFCFLELNAVL